MKVALFVRVSSLKQDYERQIKDLSAYASSQNYQIEAIIEEVISASKTSVKDRPAIRQLLEISRQGKIQKLLVWEISRLGRKPAEMLTIIEELIELNISVFALNLNLETLTPTGKRNHTASLILTVMAEIARMETEALGERIKSGKNTGREKGIHQGRNKGTTKKPEVYLKQYPGIVKDLKEGLSIRKTAAFRKVTKKTVEAVKKAIQHFETK